MPRVLMVQADTRWHDKPANFAHLRELLAAAPPCDLAVLPEMCDVGFTMRKSEATRGDSVAMACDLAAAAGVAVAAGVVAADAQGRPRNVCLVADAGGRELGRYVKRHPFPMVDEARAYAAGDGPAVVEVAGLKVGLTICYDLRHPGIWRETALVGAELILNVANWPAPRVAHWRALLVARAIENQAYVIGVNRAGTDPHVAYPGASLAVSPMGEILAELGEEEGVTSVEVDPAQVREVREKLPFLHAG